MSSVKSTVRNDRDYFRSVRLDKILKACIGKVVNVADLCELVEGYSGETLRSDCKLLSSPSMGYMKEIAVISSRFHQKVLHYQTIKPDFNIIDLEPIQAKIKRSTDSGKNKVAEVKAEDPPWLKTVNERHVPRVDKPRAGRVAMGSSMNSVMW